MNYPRPFAPAAPPAFIPLPPGAVEPAGWLRDWCLSAAAGYTGPMDAVDPVRACLGCRPYHDRRTPELARAAGPTKVAATGSTAWCGWITLSTTMT